MTSHLVSLPIRGEGDDADLEDILQYKFDIGGYFFVLETDDAVTEFFKLSSTLLVLFFLALVDDTIYLDNQSLFGAVKIGNKRTK